MKVEEDIMLIGKFVDGEIKAITHGRKDNKIDSYLTYEKGTGNVDFVIKFEDNSVNNSKKDGIGLEKKRK